MAKREPYCDIVQDVVFSLYKSKPEQPIIYVNYINIHQKWAQYYYTTKEIDELYDAKITNSEVDMD